MQLTLMRTDRDILTNLKYNTSKMLMYSVLLLLLRCVCVCVCDTEIGYRVVRDTVFVMLAKTYPRADGNIL